MKLRSGKKLFNPENQPFKLILLPVKVPKRDKPSEIVINFDESSREWRKNKVRVGEGFVYK